MVRELEIEAIDPIGNYSSVSYKSFDRGRMGIKFDPWEVDYIITADSDENELMNFLFPKDSNTTPNDYRFLNEFNEVEGFLNLLKLDCITHIS